MVIAAVYMLGRRISITGWGVGHAGDSEEFIAFARMHGIKCLVERFPLDKAQEAEPDDSFNPVIQNNSVFIIGRCVHLLAPLVSFLHKSRETIRENTGLCFFCVVLRLLAACLSPTSNRPEYTWPRDCQLRTTSSIAKKHCPCVDVPNDTDNERIQSVATA